MTINTDIYDELETRMLEEKNSLFVQLSAHLEFMTTADNLRAEEFPNIETALEEERNEREEYEKHHKEDAERWREARNADKLFRKEKKAALRENKAARIKTTREQVTGAARERNILDESTEKHTVLYNMARMKRREALERSWTQDMQLEIAEEQAMVKKKNLQQSRRDRDIQRRRNYEVEWNKYEQTRKSAEVQAHREKKWLEHWYADLVQKQQHKMTQKQNKDQFEGQRNQWAKWEQLTDVDYIQKAKRMQREANKRKKRQLELAVQKKRLHMDYTHFLQNLHFFHGFQSSSSIIPPSQHQQPQPPTTTNPSQQPQQDDKMNTSGSSSNSNDNNNDSHHKETVNGHSTDNHQPTLSSISHLQTSSPETQPRQHRHHQHHSSSSPHPQSPSGVSPTFSSGSNSSSTGLTHTQKLLQQYATNNEKFRKLNIFYPKGKPSQPTTSHRDNQVSSVLNTLRPTVTSSSRSPTCGDDLNRTTTSSIPSCFPTVLLHDLKVGQSEMEPDMLRKAQQEAQAWFAQHNQPWGSSSAILNDDDEDENSDHNSSTASSGSSSTTFIADNTSVADSVSAHTTSSTSTT